MSTFGIVINGIIIIMLLYYIVKIVLNIVKLNKDMGKLENKIFLITSPLRPNNLVQTTKRDNGK